MLEWDAIGKLWVGMLGLTVFVWLGSYVRRTWFGKRPDE